MGLKNDCAKGMEAEINKKTFGNILADIYLRNHLFYRNEIGNLNMSMASVGLDYDFILPTSITSNR